MTPERLPDKLTLCTAAQLATALVLAWRDLLGEEPKREALLVLLAQSALETGRWRSMHSNNIGNAKSVEGDGRCWTFFACSEIIGGKEKWFYPDDPVCRFRAFPTLREGAVDYLAMVHGRFGASWPALLRGDPIDFVHSLKQQGYFTAAEGPYARSVFSLYQEFTRTVPDSAFATPDDVLFTDAERERVLAQVALSLQDLSRAEDDSPPDTDPAPPEPEGEA